MLRICNLDDENESFPAANKKTAELQLRRYQLYNRLVINPYRSSG